MNKLFKNYKTCCKYLGQKYSLRSECPAMAHQWKTKDMQAWIHMPFLASGVRSRKAMLQRTMVQSLSGTRPSFSPYQVMLQNSLSSSWTRITSVLMTSSVKPRKEEESVYELCAHNTYSDAEASLCARKPSSVVSSVKPGVNKFPLIPEFLKFVKTMILELELLVLIKSFQLRKSLCALQISGILIRKNDSGKESILEESSSSHRLQTLQVFGSYLSSV
ncbi:hypothetical protein Droror1_Dr00026695 [Drosera rotundifolia]